MTYAPARRSSILKQQRRKRLRSLLGESLEARLPFDATQWLVVFDGLSHGETLEQQAQYGQHLLDDARISEQELRIVDALDLSGSFVVQTPTSVSLDSVTTELGAVPGFVYAEEYGDQPEQPGAEDQEEEEDDPTASAPPMERSDLIDDDVYEEALDNGFDYEAYLAAEKAGQIPDQSGPVDPDSSDALTNNDAGSLGYRGFTQSETSLVAFGNTVLVGYNDSGSFTSSNKFTGFSRSTDGGASFVDGGTLPGSYIGDGGDPVLARDDSSGRIYFSTLGFNYPRTIQVFQSDDNGATWSAPSNGTPGGYAEDKQWITVDNVAGPGNGNVYLLSRRFSGYGGIYFFRSTDHGHTFGPYGGTLITPGAQGAYIAVAPDHSIYAFWWNGYTLQMRKSTNEGLSFSAPKTVASGLLGGTNGDLNLTAWNNGETFPRYMRSNSFPHAAINPANGNIYVTYNSHGTGYDKADVFMVQSTNGGDSWSAPIKINDDATTNDQWQPTIAVTPDGSTLGIFYYSRQEDMTTTDGDPVNNQFKYYGRIGHISGSSVNFEPSVAVSSVPSKPEVGRDSVVNSYYMGDYNQAVATASAFHVTWSDNRTALSSGAPRMDPNVYYAQITLGLSVTASVPAMGSVVSTAPTSFTINVTEPLDASTLQASDLSVNGIPATSVTYTPGSTTVVFDYATSPVTTQGSQTLSVGAGAFARLSDGGLVSEFNSQFRYDALPLAVTATTPSAAEMFTLPGPFTLDVVFNEPIDPASLQTGDLLLSGMGGAYISGLTLLPGNTTARFTISGITKEGAFTASIAASAVTDPFGNSGTADFSATYGVDIGTVAYPTPLDHKDPFGGLIYDPTTSGVINRVGDTDSFTLDIDPDQTITVVVTPVGLPTPSLAPSIELRDPAGNLLASGSAAAGSTALLQTIHTTAGGTYRMEVGGANTTGSYTVQVILNAAQEEEETLAGASDNSRESAQDLEGSFITLATPQATAERGAVLGRVRANVVGTDFESGVLPAYFTTGSYTYGGVPDPTGRIRIKSPDGTGNSSRYALMMDKSTYGSLTLNEAIMTVDLSGLSSATLSFSHISINEEWHYPPSSFTGHYMGDGVAISDDGVHWRTILYAPYNYTWGKYSFDLVAAATAANLKLGPNFQVKFQQCDDSPIPGDGRGFDDIMITSPEQDWYSFHLDAGDQATLAAKALISGSVNLTLVDPSGASVATGSSGRTNVDTIISNFVARASGTYYAKVSGSIDTDYSLVLTRNAAFDSEGNDSQARAQDITSSQGVLGNIDASGPSKLYATGDDGTNLISIDKATGTATTIGSLGFSHAYATAFTPDGMLWTIIESSGSSARLATISLSTGAATPVGSANWTGYQVTALESDPSGNLYAADYRGRLYSVNKKTGQLSLIGNGWYGTSDLAFDASGALWGVSSYNGYLFKINPLSGSISNVVYLSGIPSPLTGLMIDPVDNSFYATAASSNSTLYRVNPFTGNTTLVGHGLGVSAVYGGDFSPASGTSRVVSNIASGWWDDSGFHNGNNQNYIAGQDGGHEYRNYFVFDLSSIKEPITGASLIATNGVVWRGPGYVSPDPSETYTLFDIATPVDTLTRSGSGNTAVFDDLGAGATYGSHEFSAADNYHTVPVTLNADGLAALNNALGGQVALGGAVTTISGAANQTVFTYTGNSNSDVKQLLLKFGSPDDWYSIDVASVDDALRLETSTPADGTGEFVNTLNPRIELYDPLGALVASGITVADGRNEFIQYTPHMTGKYRVRVYGEGGSRGEYFLSKNQSPVVSQVAVTSPIDENGVATISGTIRDVDTRDSHTVVINWGADNGTTTLTLAAGATSFSASHQYLDDNPSGTSSDDYPITLTVTDNHGASGGLATALPTVKRELVTNGGFENGGLSGWTQSSTGYSAQWTANNGTFDPQGYGGPLAPISGSYDAVASQYQWASSTTTLSQTLVVPDDVSLATFSWADRIRNHDYWFYHPVQEYRVQVLGASGNLIQEIYSTKPGDNPYQYDANYRAFDVTTLLQSLAGQTIQLSFQVQNHYAGFNVSLDDVSLIVSSHSGTVPVAPVATVNNVAPSDVALNSGTLDENGIFTLNGTFVDPGTQDTHSVVIDWGSGQGTSTVELAPGVTTFTASHQYLDDGASPGNGTPSDTYPVRVSVTDDDQGAAPPATAETSVTVNNVAPNSVAIAPDVQTYVFAVGAPQTFAGSFGDVGTLDTHTAVWTLSHVVGLSTVVETRPATLTESAGQGTVADSFAFDNDAVNQDGPGVYTVTLTVTDDDTGASTSQSSTFVVYDPSAGFVTGGGWIASPAGAYAADPTLTDKANLGFTSKYQKTADDSGQMQVEFQVGDLNFHSESFDWLVIAGARAQYQGTGTVNGAGNYGFMLTVVDGQVDGGGGDDRFRIKIWDKNNGDAVVYDNGLGAPDDDVPASVLGGGSIVVHTNGQALHAESSTAGSRAGATLTADALRAAVANAIAAWSQAGADAKQLAALSRVDVQLADLSGGLLGMASPANIVWIDVDAAGHGWSVGSSAGGIDLTTVVAHELGHILGLADLPSGDDVMSSALGVGAQRMPSNISLQASAGNLVAAGPVLSGSSPGIWPVTSPVEFDQATSEMMIRSSTPELLGSQVDSSGSRDDFSGPEALVNGSSKNSWDAALLASLVDDEDDPASELDAALEDLAKDWARST